VKALKAIQRKIGIFFTLAIVGSCGIWQVVATGPGVPTGTALNGGKLYDNWMLTNGMTAPPGNHPLYPTIGVQVGAATFRCKECHGWDYKGASGDYGLGSTHYTGIPGVFGSTMTGPQMFNLLKFDEISVPNGHGYGAWLSDTDINMVVEFLQTLVIDTDLYIDGNAQFTGNSIQGEINYTSGGGFLNCLTCHGADGTAMNFGTPEVPEWVGTIAVQNPWELLHKIRIGQPGAPMPSWLSTDFDQGAADIGLYAQINFPTAPCPADLTPVGGNGVVNIDDLVAMLNAFGLCPPFPANCPEDITPFNGNGVVNIDDLVALLNAFGGCP